MQMRLTRSEMSRRATKFVVVAGCVEGFLVLRERSIRGERRCVIRRHGWCHSHGRCKVKSRPKVRPWVRMWPECWTRVCCGREGIEREMTGYLRGQLCRTDDVTQTEDAWQSKGGEGVRRFHHRTKRPHPRCIDCDASSSAFLVGRHMCSALPALADRA